MTYTFWVPALFSRLSIVVSIFYLDLIVSLSLLIEGFLRGLELEYGIIAPVLPFKRSRKALGAVLLVGYLLVYALPKGRLVPHWPLDMAITFLTGAILFAYALWDIGQKGDS